MFFPIRTDRQLHHTPWINYGLIGLNVVLFFIRDVHASKQMIDHQLDPLAPQLLQFITYQFLHADLSHLIGNMLFLFVFGNSVEDRLGKLGFLSFYLAGGVLAGLGHCLVETVPVIGASGSVAAVTGAYLALFPLSNVTIGYWFVFIGAFEVSSIVLILFQIGHNVVMHLLGAPGVAYMAHLAGYAYGVAVGLGLLWIRLLPREPYDLLALMEQRRRQGRFRKMSRKGNSPWLKTEEGHGVGDKGTNPARTNQQRELMKRRGRISDALAEHNLGYAADLYGDLLKLDSDQVMNQQQQLDISNQLMSDGRYDVAAHAYELFLKTFKGYTQREQVELILGLIYAKYLDRRERASELLKSALSRLQDGKQRELAQGMLEEMG